MKTVKINKYSAGKKYQNSILASGNNDNFAAKRQDAIYHAIVGSVAQFDAKIATHTSLQMAIDACSDGDTIYILPGTYTGSVNLNKRLCIVGAGYDSYVNGVLTLTSSCNFGSINLIRANQFVLNSGSNGNMINAFWSIDPINLGVGNNINGVNIT